MGKTVLNRRQKQLLAIIGVVAALLLAVAGGPADHSAEEPGSTGPAAGPAVRWLPWAWGSAWK